MDILAIIKHPWPWYIAGPLIGLSIPLLLFIGNKELGISSNFRHVCAMFPSKIPLFNYNWRKETWNLIFALGIFLGAFIGRSLLTDHKPLQLASRTTTELEQLGVPVDGNLVPQNLFNWQSLFSLKGFVLMVGGGFLIGFGTRYAGGCTSGHAIMGLSNLQLPSLVAVIGFFAGGLIMTHFLLPLILKL